MAYSLRCDRAWIFIAYVLSIGTHFALVFISDAVREHDYAPEDAELSNLWLLLLGDVGATLVIFTFSVSFGNSSFYDAYWSVFPPVFIVSAMVLQGSSGLNVHTFMCLFVTTMWAFRLTGNWVRSWTGLDHEDWRYLQMKEQAGGSGLYYWAVVSLFGIHVFPTVIVFLALVPAYTLVLDHRPGEQCVAMSAIAFVVCFLGVVIEFTADEQLRWFAVKKANKARPAGSVIDEGLWRYSRHPNYFGQLLFWCGIALYGFVSYHPILSWVGIAGPGALLLMFLFASIPMMEDRMAKRRPAYEAYQDRVVSPLIPWFRAGDDGDEADNDKANWADP